MLFEDLVIAIVLVNGDDGCDGDCTKDDEDNNGWWQKPCNSDPDVHSLAPVPRQLLKFLSARVDCDKADRGRDDEDEDGIWWGMTKIMIIIVSYDLVIVIKSCF